MTADSFHRRIAMLGVALIGPQNASSLLSTQNGALT